MCATTNGAGTTTSLTYPGNVPGLVTNCVGYTTIAAYPGPKQCMSTNCSKTLTSKKTFHRRHILRYSLSNRQRRITTLTGTIIPFGYTYANVFSYTYPVYNYTYAIQFSYTTHLHYIYPTYTYSYVVYTGSSTTPRTITIIFSIAAIIYQRPERDHDRPGTARLVMPSGLSMNGQDQMTIDTSGSLKLYSGGNSLTMVAMVPEQDWFCVQPLCLCNSERDVLHFNGNGEFTGVLIAPNATPE